MDGNCVSKKKQRLDHASLQRPQPSAATKADPCKRGDQGFQELLGDQAIQGAVHTKKVNLYTESGKPTSAYCYKLLR